MRLHIEANMRQVERFAARLADGFSARGMRVNLQDLVEVLKIQHEEAFNVGGQQHRGGPAWPSTHPYWVRHMEGHSGKPLVWTGAGRRSYRGIVRSSKLMEFGTTSPYLPKFQFADFDPKPSGGTLEIERIGPYTFREKFSIKGGGRRGKDASLFDSPERRWVKSRNRTSTFYTRTIKVRRRVILAIYQSDIDHWLDFLAPRLGLA